MTACNETALLFADMDAPECSPNVVDLNAHRRHAVLLPALSDLEVLAMLIDTRDALDTARALLMRFGGIAGVMGATPHALSTVAGVGPALAMRIKVTHEATLRVTRGEIRKRTVISSWTALLAYAKVAMAHRGTEEFRVFFLDKKNQLIADEVMNQGTVDHAPVYPREIVKRALELDASAVILAHNHPSGDPTPSGADVEMTKQVAEACRPLRLTVHDHIVVGREGVVSLKSLGLF